MRYFIAWILALVAFMSPAHAQIGNPGFMRPDTHMSKPGIPAPNQPNDTDQLFARLAAASGMAEVRLGNMTADKAQGDAVKDFANRMVKDHGTANDKLAQLAKAAKIPLPAEVTPDHQKMISELEGRDGREYDLAYLQGQIVEHQKAAQLLEWEINSG